jgi:thioredoxin-like negative regulator of GroEL
MIARMMNRSFGMESRQMWACAAGASAVVVAGAIVLHFCRGHPDIPVGTARAPAAQARDDRSAAGTGLSPHLPSEKSDPEANAVPLSQTGVRAPSGSVPSATDDHLEVVGEGMPADVPDLPLPSLGESMNQALRDAVRDTREKVRGAKSLAEKARYIEAFIRAYPLGSATPVMMNDLARVYVQLKRFRDAEQILRHAKLLAGNDRYAMTVELTQAFLDFSRRDLAQTEARLQQIMAKPLPKSFDDPYAIAPQCFKAPLLLAKVYRSSGNMEGAFQVLQKATERGLELVNNHADAAWLPSHVAEVYWQRVAMTLAMDPRNVAAARTLADEMKQRLPSYEGPRSYRELLATIDRARAAEEPSGKEPSTEVRTPADPRR